MAFDDLLFATLCMTFGGAACPLLWSYLSEAICDLGNSLLQCKEWDHTLVQSPSQHLIPGPTMLPDNVPFAKAAESAVELPLNNRGITDVYKDDVIPVCPDI